MDYRKPVVFGENWSPSRYAVLPYFAAEKSVMAGRPAPLRLLDLGCAAGWNMSRFRQYGLAPVGVDVVPERVALAAAHGPVAVASGLRLPFADSTFDVIYVQHVLHHIGDVGQALSEIRRCLKPGGVFFLVETVEDNPLIRWGRRLYPRWLGDEVNAPFRFTVLRQDLARHGFTIWLGRQYSVLFWIWEIFPDRFPILEKLTPLFVLLERPLATLFRRWAAHCFLVAEKSEVAA